MKRPQDKRFSVQPVRLSRRTALRGLGLSVALPTLEAMVDGRGRWFTGRAYAAPPVRMVTFFFPCGWGAYTAIDNGARGDEGKNLDMMLGAGGVLAPVKNDTVVLRNLYKLENKDAKKSPPDEHDSGHGSFATGMGITQTGAAGPSIDQVAVDKLKPETRFPSVALAIGKSNNVWVNYISWKGPEKPVPAENDPAKVWASFFGSGPIAGPAIRDYRKSMLSYLKDDVTRLQAKLGAADKAKLDEHFTALREIERDVELEASGAACATKPMMPIAGSTAALSNERAQLLLRMLTVALQCNLTNIASFQLANRRDNRQFPWLGIGEIGGINGGKYELGHHALSHDGSEKGADLQRKIVADEVAQFVYFVNQLKAAQDVGGTLFSSSIVFLASEHQNGAHQVSEVPVILAGQAGGKLKTGREIKYPQNKSVPYANALTSVLQLVGVQVPKFGTHGTGPLDL